jgi:hypothetical protein
VGSLQTGESNQVFANLSELLIQDPPLDQVVPFVPDTLNCP